MPQAVHDCAMKLIAEGKDEQSAWAICNASVGGSNFVSYELDNKGDLYLKYFMADASITALPTATGHFSLNGAAIASHDQEAIGLPFTILPNKELSVYGDFHPWHPDLEKATWGQHVEFARRFSPGKIVKLTPHSELQGAAQEVVNNQGRFAIVQITDPVTRDAYIKNPHLIPKSVSPGFLNHESPNRTNIQNFQWAHLAAVPQGAFGDKATVYASCIGGNDCVDKLVGASVLKAAEKPYCPIGASEFLSSLVNSDINPSQMSDNANTVAVASTPAVTPTQAPVANTGAPIAAPAPAQPILRLKTAQQGQPPVTGLQQSQQPSAVNFEEFDKVRKQVEEIKIKEAENARLQGLKALVPRELFILPNQRFDEKGFESDVTKLVKAGFDPNNTDHQAMIQEHYNNLSELIKYKMSNGNPLGGSSVIASSDYKTPSQVAEPQGAGADPVAVKTKALFQMWGLNK